MYSTHGVKRERWTGGARPPGCWAPHPAPTGTVACPLGRRQPGGGLGSAGSIALLWAAPQRATEWPCYPETHLASRMPFQPQPWYSRPPCTSLCWEAPWGRAPCCSVARGGHHGRSWSQRAGPRGKGPRRGLGARCPECPGTRRRGKDGTAADVVTGRWTRLGASDRPPARGARTRPRAGRDGPASPIPGARRQV